MGKKKKNKKKDKAPEGYVEFGSVLGIDTTMVQAAKLLDKVSMDAYNAGDSERMMQAAAGWLQLGALMHAAFDEEAKPEDDGEAGTSIMGFGSREAREKAEAVNREQRKRIYGQG